MIIQTKVNNRPATVSFLDAQFRPVDSEHAAELVEVTFNDDEGGMAFLVPQAHSSPKPATSGAHAKEWPRARARAEANLSREQRWHVERARSARLLARRGVKFDPDEPRDDHGMWTDGGGSDADIKHEHSAGSAGPAQKQTFYELKPSSSGLFHRAISEAKAANEHGAAVEVHSPEEYRGMRTFLSPDHKSGFALAGNNIVSLFKHPGSNAKGLAGSALALATKEGGQRLDAFDTELPHLYSDAGFKSVGRIPFDDKYAPPGWNKETFKQYNGGRPDVVFMVHDPVPGMEYKPGDGPRVADYNAGEDAQAKELGSIPARDAKIASIVAKVPGAAEGIAKAVAKIAKEQRTTAPVNRGGFKDRNGKWIPERQAIHQKILSDLFSSEKVRAATPPPGQRPTLHLLGGSGGSGKSWFVKTGKVPANAIYINSDDIKSALPGYHGYNAGLFHEESSDVAKEAEARARDLGVNVVLDGTMSGKTSLDKRIGAAKAAGYKVAGHFMRVTPETSVTRALQRFVRGGNEGRFVVPQYIMGSDNAKNFNDDRDKMDSWEIYDNEGDKPKLVASSKA